MSEASESSTANDEPKLKFELLVQKYFEQLTKGCGNEECKNEFCRSSRKAGGELNPHEAAEVAINLATQGSQHHPQYFFCGGIGDEQLSKLISSSAKESLHYPIMVYLCSTAKSTGDFNPLIQAIKTVFSNPNALNVSFLKRDLGQDEPSCDTSGIDLPRLRDAYKLLESLPERNVTQALGSAIRKAIVALEQNKVPFENLRQLRVFLILMECPLLMEPLMHDALAALCKAIVELPIDSRQIIVRWWSNYPADPFKRLVALMQQYITVQLYKQGYIDEKVAWVVGVLRLLYDSNQLTNRVPYSEFYNDAVNTVVDLKQDFTRWVKSRTNRLTGFNAFSFCDNSFILDPASKSKILQIEAREQQSRELESAILRYAIFHLPENPFLVLRVRRENLLYTALTELNSKVQDLKKPLKVQFIGEEGIDEGGVRKEFFQLILRHVFDVNFGMFTYNDETRTFWFNGQSFETEAEFKLIGIIVGLAIYNGVILDIRFPLVVYKKLLGITPTLTDLKDIDPMLARGLEQLLSFDGDVENTYCRTFTAETEYFGKINTHELKPNGAQIPVTNENRQEYVDLFVTWFLEQSVEKQFQAFSAGFSAVVAGPTIKLCRPEELELLICGSPELDFDALEKNTKYDDGYTKDSPTIRNFWSVVNEFTVDQKKKLLMFATGSDRVPIRGLGNLLFVISRNGPDSDKLPTAHTCFNHLLLPDYKTRDKLRERLVTAIENSEGFGLI